MSKAFVTATALSTPFLPNRGIDAKNVQEAIEKLAFLTYANSLAGAIYTDDGDVTIRIGTAETSLVLPSNTGRWRVSINDLGEITSQQLESSDESPITYWRFKRSDGSRVAVEITDEGEVIMVNSPEYAGLSIKSFYLRSPSNYLFTLGVNEDDEFYTESTGAPPNPKFRVISQDNQVLFSTVEHRQLALNYMPTYSVSDLPALPVGMNEVVPMAFVKNGTLHKPVYHDGTIWRYLNTDMPVVKEVTTNPVVLNYLLLPSSTGFWKLTATDSGEISTSKYPNIGSNSPLPTPLLVSSSVGIWYVSADASGTPRTQLIGGTYPPTQVRISSDNLVWEVLASNTGEIFLQRI
jgi:hypothetical protein